MMPIVFRASLIFLFLLLISRALGRRQLGELGPLEMIVFLTMGDLVQQGVTQEDYSLTGAMLAVGTMAFWSVCLARLSFRYDRANKALEGSPVIVLRDGRPLEDILKKHRIRLDDLHEGAREHGIGDLSEVNVGILESSGDFTFIKK